MYKFKCTTQSLILYLFRLKKLILYKFTSFEKTKSEIVQQIPRYVIKLTLQLHHVLHDNKTYESLENHLKMFHYTTNFKQ